MKNLSYLIQILLFIIGSCNQKDIIQIDLSGEWKFQIDSLDEGVLKKWYIRPLDETVTLPGSMVENGKGYPVDFNTIWTGNIRKKDWYKDKNYKPYINDNKFLFPYWLIPERHYYGAAWYQKNVKIPSNWKGSNIELFLERCHWETQVWVDDKKIGNQNSLGTAHRYDLSKFLTPGNHRISICVDNRIKGVNVGPDSHSITDHTQSNWNGIVGELKLIKKARVSISRVSIFPDIEKQIATIEFVFDNSTGSKQLGELMLQALSVNSENSVTVKPLVKDIIIGSSTEKVVVEYPMGKDVLLWDEFNPNLYSLMIELKIGSTIDKWEETFGMREFNAKGTSFKVNGRPIFLRGTLECAIFPKTGYPPTDIDSWKRIINICRAHGLNHIRFHSWCPPEAAFEAADELGFYYQIECSSWANTGSSVGDNSPIDKWLYKESERMIKEYGNHPSFCMMAYGNEPAGKNQNKYLGDFVSYWKTKDNRRVYTGGAGWPELPENDFHNLPGPRIQGWGEGLKSIINSQAPRTDYDWSDRIVGINRPIVSHEIGQWCVYPNLKEIDKYDGILKAKNFEIFKRSLDAHKMSHLADSFLIASGKLQALCYKAEIEAALRTPGFAGFQLLDLHDFPGQGTALVGVLDPFWEEKGYISPGEYKRFCNETVPLARLEKRVFLSNEKIIAKIEVAHFGEKELQSVTPIWRIIDKHGTEVQTGELATTNIPWGNGIKLGEISTKISTSKPLKLILEVEIADFSNDWDFWVYPSEQTGLEKEVLVVQNLNQKAISVLKGGGEVLLTIKKEGILNEVGEEIGIGFSSIFWNTAWTGGQKPHTLGILCNPEHSALSEFPTEFYSNWQWWDAMSHSKALSLENFSTQIKPIVRVIDDWVTNRRLALIFEGKVGKGKLLVSGVDLVNDMKNRPEARQLLYSLKKYMLSEQFSPQAELDIHGVQRILK